MKKTSGIVVSPLVVALALLPASVGAAGLAERTSDMGMGAQTVTVSRNVGPYRLTLAIGPMETMYTQAQVKRSHPKDGEVMLRGSMVMGGGMNMKMPNHHLELHVMDRHTMHPVSDAMVTISYAKAGGKSMSGMGTKPTQVPIAVMMGIGEGLKDVHYGNNVTMGAGAYRVSVRVNTVSATFTIKVQ